MNARLIVCGKSRWAPAIRREHALSAQAAAHGVEVVFLERPRDVRGLLAAREQAEAPPGIDVRPGLTLAPAHRGGLAERLEARRLRAAIDRAAGEDTVAVATQPWQWPAVAASRASRRVFDCADDWRALMPRHATRVDELHRAIGREADAVVLAAPDLAPAFAEGQTVTVPNATGPELLATPPAPAPVEGRVMTYAGTLSERVDLALLDALLEALPEWRLELVGQCQFAGRGERPSPALERLLARHGDRARLRGPVARERLAAELDAAAVLLVPHREDRVRGQDPMKLYDYAARGRPIVSTVPAGPAEAGIRVAREPADFAQAVLFAAAEDEAPRVARRAWAEGQTWRARWPAWAAAVLGEPR